jgi:hypothetical protein
LRNLCFTMPDILLQKTMGGKGRRQGWRWVWSSPGPLRVGVLQADGHGEAWQKLAFNLGSIHRTRIML